MTRRSHEACVHITGVCRATMMLATGNACLQTDVSYRHDIDTIQQVLDDSPLQEQPLAQAPSMS